jgi:hydrogenase expression/formation protein HypC
MCLGVPMQLRAVDGIVGRAEDRGAEALVDLSLVPDAAPGDWVLVFLGAARSRLEAGEAAKIAAALAGLASLMAGGALGDAFADLDARPPTLPPHLQAALDAGQATG